jgi:hypothetical protein
MMFGIPIYESGGFWIATHGVPERIPLHGIFRRPGL